MLDFEFLDCLHKVGAFLKTPVNAREADVGDFIEFPETFHHQFSDGGSGHFVLVVFADGVGHAFGEVLDGLGADRAFLAGSLETGEELFPGEWFASSVALDDNKGTPLDLLVGGKAVAAAEAFAPPTDGGALARRSRINHLVFKASTF
jgi:hypothetical protein